MAEINRKPDANTGGATEERQPGSEPNVLKQASDMGGEAMLNAAQTMAEVARMAMDQGQEAIRICITTMTGANAPVAESTYLQSRRVAEHGAGVMAAYHEALDRSADEMRAFVAAGSALAHVMQRWQRAYFDAVQKTFDSWGRRPQELARCTTPSEAARVQRDMYFDLLRGIVEYNTAVLHAAAEVTQEAARPLQERVRR